MPEYLPQPAVRITQEIGTAIELIRPHATADAKGFVQPDSKQQEATEVCHTTSRFASFAHEVAQPFFTTKTGDGSTVETEALNPVIADMTSRLMSGSEQELPLQLEELSGSDLLLLGRMVGLTSEPMAKRAVYLKIIEKFPNDLFNTSYANTSDGEHLDSLFHDKMFLRLAMAEDIQRTAAKLQNGVDVKPGPKELMGHPESKLQALCIREVMNRGFEPHEAHQIVASWETLSGNEHFDNLDLLFKNLNRLESIAKIDAALPGKLFRERGIAHFGRYSEKLLASQFDPLPEGVAPDFVIMARLDHNGAFYDTMSRLESQVEDYIDTFRIAEAGDATELIKRVDALFNTTGQKKAKNIIIGAHGSTEAMCFGEDKLRYKNDSYIPVLTRKEVNDRLAALRQMVDPSGNLILVSCSTGAEGAISETANTVSGLSTLAPMIPANIDTATRLPDGRIAITFWDGAISETTTRTLPAVA